jgi:hypothetical protein
MREVKEGEVVATQVIISSLLTGDPFIVMLA